MSKYIIIYFGFLLLGGCSTSGRIGDMPKIIDRNSVSKIIVIRVNSIVGGANTYTVSLNGKDFFNIRSGQYTDFMLNKGEHYIAVKCFGGWTPTWKEDAIKFLAESNKPNYFEISPNFSCAEIVEIDKIKAATLMKSSEYVNLTKKLEEKPQRSDDEN